MKREPVLSMQCIPRAPLCDGHYLRLVFNDCPKTDPDFIPAQPRLAASECD
jgi:hypothetical protein